jgi:hypothetical protein
MSQIYGRYRAGRVELESPVDWPDGLRVALTPDDSEAAELSASPDDRAAILQLMDEIEPLELTPHDEAEIAAARAAVRAVTLKAVEQRLRGES